MLFAYSIYEHSSYLHCRDYEQLALKYISTVIAVEKSAMRYAGFFREVAAALSSLRGGITHAL